MATATVETGSQTKCKRCKDADAPLVIRSDPVCSDCYRQFIATKTVKRFEVLNREIRLTSRPVTRKYLAGLSFGPCSAALVDLCEQTICRQLERKANQPFEIHVVYIDTDLAADAFHGASPTTKLLDQWRERYPRFTFQSIPLAAVLELAVIDWSALPPRRPDVEPSEQLRYLFEDLPSATSRADLLRLFIRHLLLSVTAQGSFEALLLGCSTTALAELTLIETAKGRGFSLPWQISDGVVPVPDTSPKADSASSRESRGISLYYPLRDLFRKELITYASLVTPSFSHLVANDTDRGKVVVSHKDLSIEEVLVRYFAEVEDNYPSVVANVVRTTAKLERLEDIGQCGVCGMGLDEQGDEKWRGEIGDDDGGTQPSRATRPLCYGCERSLRD